MYAWREGLDLCGHTRNEHLPQLLHLLLLLVHPCGLDLGLLMPLVYLFLVLDKGVAVEEVAGDAFGSVDAGEFLEGFGGCGSMGGTKRCLGCGQFVLCV